MNSNTLLHCGIACEPFMLIHKNALELKENVTFFGRFLDLEKLVFVFMQFSTASIVFLFYHGIIIEII